MRIVLDTNVLVSGIFFGGVPGEILQGWREGEVQLVISPEIYAEYREVGEALEARYPGTGVRGWLDLFLLRAEVVAAPGLDEPASADPEDDKFLACAVAAGARCLVSGDRHLLSLNGFRGIEILRPREFVERFQRRRDSGA